MREATEVAGDRNDSGGESGPYFRAIDQHDAKISLRQRGHHPALRHAPVGCESRETGTQLNRNDAIGWASVSAPTLQRAWRSPIVGAETDAHPSARSRYQPGIFISASTQIA